jgi:hypothetical protein
MIKIGFFNDKNNGIDISLNDKNAENIGFSLAATND